MAEFLEYYYFLSGTALTIRVPPVRFPSLSSFLQPDWDSSSLERPSPSTQPIFFNKQDTHDIPLYFYMQFNLEIPLESLHKVDL